MSIILIVLIVILAIAVFGGGWNSGHYNPIGIVLLILLILLLTGNLGHLKL